MPSPIDEGLASFRPEFLADHRALYDCLATDVAWDDRIRARRAASFGVPYNIGHDPARGPEPRGSGPGRRGGDHC